MTPGDLYKECVAGFEGRRFQAGLLVALIDFFKVLETPRLKLRDFADFLKKYPQQTTTAAGKRANTLIVRVGVDKTLSLRPFYNSAESYFRAAHKRFDYPSCAPHATQAWQDYRPWLDALCGYSERQLDGLREKVCEFILETLPSHEFKPGSVPAEPPLFKRVLTAFDATAHAGEKTGAALQGIVFGFLRADNPHLQIEISKVRTGSKRLQRVGDIDAWEGKRLAISAEVKQFVVKDIDVADLEAFANATQQRSAIGIVFALGFDDLARSALLDRGVQPVDIDEMLKIVELWDTMKQRTAVASLIYYVTQVEKNNALAERLDKFLKAVGAESPEAHE